MSYAKITSDWISGDLVFSQKSSSQTGVIKFSDVPMRVGIHDWGVGETGIEIDTTDPLFQIAGKVTDEDADSGVYASLYTQLALTADQANDVSMFASWNELYITDADLTGSSNHYGVYGYIEVAGTTVTPTGNLCALSGAFTIPATLTNNGVIAGVHVDMILNDGYTDNGVIAAFHVGSHTDPGQNKIPYGLYIPSAAVSYPIYVPGIPTSDPSIAGVLWSDSGTVKVSAG